MSTEHAQPAENETTRPFSERDFDALTVRLSELQRSGDFAALLSFAKMRLADYAGVAAHLRDAQRLAIATDRRARLEGIESEKQRQRQLVEHIRGALRLIVMSSTLTASELQQIARDALDAVPPS